MLRLMRSTRKKPLRAAVNKVTAGFRLSDELWAVLAPELPKHRDTHRFGGGKPRTPDRQCADAIFYVLRTGCQRGALDATELCPHSTAHDRFQAWVAAGVFRKLWKAGVEQFDELKGIDWNWLSMDGALTKAPLGGEKTRPPSHRPRQTGRQTQPADEAHGVPIGLAMAGANRHDMKLVKQTVNSLVGKRPRPTKKRPQGMCLDKGYDYAEVRDTLKEFGFTAHIRARGEEAQTMKRHAGVKARRWVVERTHSWMNRFRRVFIRWDKSPDNYLAFLHFACALIAFRASGLFG
jgi:putative transposase